MNNQRGFCNIHMANFKKSWKNLKHQSRVFTFQKLSFICFNESPLKMLKNAFYFIFKPFFVLKIFKLLYCVFGHVGNTAFTLSETILSEVTEGKTYYKKGQKSFFVS